jgi:hypothetical protein
LKERTDVATNSNPVFEVVRRGALGGWEPWHRVNPNTDPLRLLDCAFNVRHSERERLLARIGEAERLCQWSRVATLEALYRSTEFRVRRRR